jgi:integrase
MQFRHGRYYFVKAGKWHPLERDYGASLRIYADLVGAAPRLRTVRDAVWNYIEYASTRKMNPLKKATVEGYTFSAANLCAVFGKVELEDVDREMVVAYLSETGTVQANRDKALLSAAFTHAKNHGALKGKEDPTKKLQFRVPESPRERYVTDLELASLVEKASPKLATITRFVSLTGLRTGDALRVRMADLDDEGIHVTIGKTGKRIVILWSPELAGVVDQAKGLWRRFGREWLFESRPVNGKRLKRPVGPYTPSGLRALWRVARIKAGLPDVRLHDLRGKAGSDVATQADAQRLLGHADGKVTGKHYRRKPERVNPVR